MTKKDYEMIASVLHETIIRADGQDAATRDAVSSIAYRLSVRFREDNPRFNSDKFFKAVRG